MRGNSIIEIYKIYETYEMMFGKTPHNYFVIDVSKPENMDGKLGIGWDDVML